jgi:asparagine synthase (glutamine-hydrolysing)
MLYLSSSLELRVPFLDHFFTSYFFSLPADEKTPTRYGCEKYLIRKAFAGMNIIPEDILWRPKEAFSDGVAHKKKSLFEHLQERIEPLVSDEQFSQAAARFPFNTPQTKEAFYYRSLFEEMFPNCAHFTPYMWLPKWCGNVVDPSARVLKHYDTQQSNQKELNNNIVV